MKLALHIVRKDFLRLRGWLALWALVLAAKVVIGWLARAGEFSSASVVEEQHLATTVTVLSWLDGLITFLLAVLLVQEDRLMGTRLFWVTRPISGGRLLAAKVIGVVLILGGLPVLVALPWWLTCGFGMRDVAWAVLEMIGWQVAIALPAMLMASLTDSLARAFLWTVVLVVASASGTVLWRFLVVPSSGGPNMELAWARTWILVAVLALAAVTAIMLQFFMRRFVRALMVLGGGIVAAVAIAGWWPATWASKFECTEMNPERAKDVTLQFDKATCPDTEMNIGRRDNPLQVSMTARGVPAGCWLVGYRDSSGGDDVAQTLRWPGGPTLVRDGRVVADSTMGRDWTLMSAAMGLRDPQPDAETKRALFESWQKLRESVQEQRKRTGLGSIPPSSMWPPPKIDSSVTDLRAFTPVPRSLAARMRAQPASYEARFWLELRRLEVWFEVPLRAGGWHDHAGHALKVAAVGRVPDVKPNWRGADQMSVNLLETWPTTSLGDWPMFYFLRHQRRDPGEPYAVNRSTGQAEPLNYGRAGPSIRICSVYVTWRTLSFNVPKLSRNGQWVDSQPPWLEGATLALIGHPEEARFVRELKVERLEITK